MEEEIYWLAFSLFPGIGPVKFKKLLKYFGSAKKAWLSSLEDLKSLNMGSKIPEDLIEFRNKFSPEKVIFKLKKQKINFLTLLDKNYPSLLSQTPNPPIVLYIKGDFDFNNSNSKFIAVVGTRNITSYGTQITKFLVRELTSSGCVIISGLALGVDSIAHSTAIQQRGKTIAVLGCGVDYCYPAQNALLYKNILSSGGAIISEYPPGQKPSRGSFPSRNRIIAGLSSGTIVTEGASDSGALITADFAFKAGRKVFAIPGPITSSYSKGPNQLLSKGAIPVSSSEDILKTLKLSRNQKSTNQYKVTPEEKIIVEHLQDGQMHIDEIVKNTKLPAAKISTILSILELKNIVQNIGSGNYCLSNIN